MQTHWWPVHLDLHQKFFFPSFWKEKKNLSLAILITVTFTPSGIPRQGGGGLEPPPLSLSGICPTHPPPPPPEDCLVCHYLHHFNFVGQKNTYQAVLTTDGKNLAMMVFFKCDLMNWNAEVQPVDPLIGSVLDYTTFNSRADAYAPDTVDGNTGHRGQYVFRLDTNTDDYINPRSWCLAWYNSAESEIDLSPRLRNRCPCTKSQVLFLPRFQICALPLPADVNTHDITYPGKTIYELLWVPWVFLASSLITRRMMSYDNFGAGNIRNFH